MTGATPRAPATRLVAVLVFIGLPALFLTLTLLNGLQIADDRMTAREKQAQAAALERRLGAAAGAGRPPTQAAVFIEGTSRTAAIAGLQQRLVDAIAAVSGRVIETAATDGPVSEGGDGDAIDVKATLDIDNDGLLRLLYGLESGLPLIDVRPLSIRRLPGGDETAGTGLLRVDMTVRAHWRPKTP